MLSFCIAAWFGNVILAMPFGSGPVGSRSWSTVPVWTGSTSPDAPESISHSFLQEVDDIGSGFRVNLTELKTFPNPPAAVINVSAGVMVLLAPRGHTPNDRIWKAAQAFIGKVDDFLQTLVSYDKEHTPEACLNLDLDVSLHHLTSQFKRVTGEKVRCQEDLSRTNQIIELANRLSEMKHWSQAEVEYMEQRMPDDQMSIENAAILTTSECWPLIVDPQHADHPTRLLVTHVGLEDQLLGKVVTGDPTWKLSKQNHFKIELKSLEDHLLSCLSAAKGYFFNNISLVEQMEGTKTAVAHIHCKVRPLRQEWVPFSTGVTKVFLKAMGQAEQDKDVLTT
ncbi:unnamed protein product [Lota lota]